MVSYATCGGSTPSVLTIEDHNVPSTKKKRRQVWRRDERRCGIHLDGCGEIIKLDDATVDHIVPQGFLRHTDIDRCRWSAYGNIQPMHRACNEMRGMGHDVVIGTGKLPEFKCDCHYWKIDEDKVYLHGPNRNGDTVVQLVLPRSLVEKNVDLYKRRRSRKRIDTADNQ